MTNVNYAASLTTILELIHSTATVSRFNLMVLHIKLKASFAAADCPFWQDAHCRMALVIARIRLAEDRELAEGAQDSEYVNGEKLFSSSSSAK